MSMLLVGLLVIIVLSIVLGEPLYVLIGSVAAWLLMASGQYPTFEELKPVVEMTRELADKEVLLAIPFFVISGAIMSEGDIARRLIDVAQSTFSWLSGGLAVSTVLACVFFAAISGSSPVTVIAIGSIMYPALLAEGYPDRFSTGLVTSAGSLGILIPPSIPMIVYAIIVPNGFQDPAGYNVAGAEGSLGLVELFLAGIGPGILIGGILATFAVLQGRRQGAAVGEFRPGELIAAIRHGMWALLLPVIILGGIYTGVFTPTQAAAVSVLYALIVELWIHRSLTLHEIPRVLAESTVLIGALLVILALAQGFNKYLTLAQIAEHSVALFETWNLTPVAFLLLLNVLLLIVGCFMDILSAILILVPLLSPIAFGLGIHPMHLAVVIIVNLEIGYLTPPLGLNLFVASTIFRKGLGDVIRSVLPFMLLMLSGLIIVTYVPTVSLGPVSLRNGEGFVVPFPEKRIAMATLEVDDAVRFLSSLSEDGADAPEQEEEAEDPGRPLTIEEMMAAANAEQEAAALEGLAYAGVIEMLHDYRRILSGEMLLEEVGEDW